MEMTIWILFCLFASIGFVQCGVWLREMLCARPKPHAGYRVIPLYNDAEHLEGRLRYVLSLPRRDGEYVLLVDMGLSGESQEICNRLIRESCEVYICDKDELVKTLACLDEIQYAHNE